MSSRRSLKVGEKNRKQDEDRHGSTGRCKQAPVVVATTWWREMTMIGVGRVIVKKHPRISTDRPLVFF
jgi:hypothetical protein